MTTIVETPSTDLFRLSFCPGCDYSLIGLPDVGICPECGRKYDRSFIVLRGTPVLSSGNNALIARNNKNPKQFAWSFIPIGIWIFATGGIAREPTLFLIFGFVFASYCLDMIAWHSAVRRGETLVWLSSTGIMQEPAQNPKLLATMLRRWLLAAYMLALVILITVQHHTSSGIYVFLIVIVISSVLRQFRFAHRLSTAVEGSDIKLFAWKLFDLIRLGSQKNNRWQLLAHVDTRFYKSNLVNLEFSATPEDATQLRSFIKQWHADARRAASLPVARRSRWRKIGRGIRRIFYGPA